MARSSIRCLVRRDTYRDSIELMRVAAEVERLPGVLRAAALMATPANRAVLAEANLATDEAGAAGPSDLIVAVAASGEEAASAALDRAASLLAGQAPASSQSAGAESPAPQTIAEALTSLAPANLAIISVPGPYATAEALKALKRGLHVFLFSDNVSIEDEILLKGLARERGLLVMGPDCGTAILDGVPIGFANVVRRGPIGLVGASGTGLQQVSCLIDRLGEGLSQVIGVGGHDLDARVGGLMMRSGIERLAADPGTAVVVLVSKPPAAAVAETVLASAVRSGKPVVVNFLGGDPAAIQAAGATPATTLEEAATMAVSLTRRGHAGPRRIRPGKRQPLAPRRGAAPRLAPRQRYVRGLFSGGTLCQEAALILAGLLGDGETGPGFTAVDLGDDEFTRGRPHPMIDFRLRNERIVAAAEDPTTGVILLDVVLGYGAHPDPAGALRPAIEQALATARRARRGLAVVAAVCGTAADPQGLARQEASLAAAGVLLAPSNAEAAKLAASLLRPPSRARKPAPSRSSRRR